MRPWFGWYGLLSCGKITTIRHLTNQSNDVYQAAGFFLTVHNRFFYSYRTHMTSSFLTGRPVAGVLVVGFACHLSTTALAQKPPVETLDKGLVKAIDFRLGEDNLEALELNASLTTLEDRIRKNLSEWNFPLRIEPGKAYSHNLYAVVGRAVHQSTPVGFSFSAGNSDPRASEFQKADVIEIGCSLTSVDEPQQSVQQTMEFDVQPINDGRNKAKAMELLVDHVSTVCFNLLDDLELEKPIQADAPVVAKPGWMPEIRVETVTAPAAAEITKSAPAVPEQTAKPAGKKEDEGRKQVIIHNQGTPVILKFGYERK